MEEPSRFGHLVVSEMRQVETWFIGIISGYEFAALVAHSDRLPTITDLVGRLPRTVRRSIGLLAGMWLVAHFNPDLHQ